MRMSTSNYCTIVIPSNAMWKPSVLTIWPILSVVTYSMALVLVVVNLQARKDETKKETKNTISGRRSLFLNPCVEQVRQ